MKQKLRNLTNALLIGEQMPDCELKARQLRSFFIEVDQIFFDDNNDQNVMRISMHAVPWYRFVYINDVEGIHIHIEACISETTQTVDVKKNNIPQDN